VLRATDPTLRPAPHAGGHRPAASGARLVEVAACQCSLAHEASATVPTGDAGDVRPTSSSGLFAAALVPQTTLRPVVWSYAIVKPEYFRNAQREHRAMIKALKDGDRKRLVELCAAHLNISRAAYLETWRLRFRG
jgi:hypothetical protein